MSIILASASPRRKQLLALVCDDFEIAVADVDETNICADTPAQLAQDLAQKKCMAVADKFANDIVIGCDTVVNLNGTVLGKPKTEQEAIDMLTKLKGKKHYVHTGVYIFSKKASAGFVTTSCVHFDNIPDSEIAQYALTTEPYDKAGGYGIQGWAAKYIAGIEGCFFNIMGLPVHDVHKMLKKLCEI